MSAIQKKVMVLTLVFLLSCVGVLGLSSITDTYPESNSFVSQPSAPVNATTDAAAVNVTHEWINSTGGVEATSTIANDKAGDTFFNESFSTSVLVEGRTYTINFTATNSSGATATTQVTNVTVDGTGPLAGNTNIVSPADGANVTDTTPDITFNISDNLAGTITYNLSVNGTQYNGTMKNGEEKTVTITSALAVGSYTVSVTGTDEAGNVGATDSITLNIVSPPSTSTSSGGGGKTSTWSTRTSAEEEEEVTIEDIKDEVDKGAVTRELSFYDEVSYDGDLIRILNIDYQQQRISLEISNREQHRLSMGDVLHVDVDGDGENDVKIRVETIDTRTATLVISEVTPPKPTAVELQETLSEEDAPEEVMTEAPEVEEEPQEETSGLSGAATRVLSTFREETPLPVKLIAFLLPLAIGLLGYSAYGGKEE